MKPNPFSLAHLEPGSVLAGRFRIVAQHRKGGLVMAFEGVDEAEGESDGPESARRELQLFPASLFDGEEQALEFSASWTPWKRVQSDSVLTVREIVALGGAGFLLVTDFPGGDSLREVLAERRPLPPGEVLEIGRAVLAGLVEIHLRGLVHGDVKPNTIYLCGSERRAVLVDGGITPALWRAKDLGEKTALIGTPFYAPIEQFGGDSPNIQSDVYNVATVLFELLTGVLPWPGTSFLEVFQAKLDKRPPSMAERAPGVEVDPRLEEVIVTGLLAAREERYASARDFLERLEAF